MLIFSFRTGEGVLTISDAVYTTKELDVNTQETTAAAVRFKPDGTRVFVGGVNGLFEYSMTVAWDVSTGSYTGNSANVGGGDSILGLEISSDGTNLYVSTSGDSIRHYTMSPGWDLSSLSFQSALSSTGTGAWPSGIELSPSGSILIVLSQTAKKLGSYALSTAYDLSSASSTPGTTVNVTGSQTPADLFIRAGGKDLVILDSASPTELDQYAMTTAWDLSTYQATKTDSNDISSESSIALGLDLKDVDKVYITGNDINAVYQYDM